MTESRFLRLFIPLQQGPHIFFTFHPIVIAGEQAWVVVHDSILFSFFQPIQYFFHTEFADIPHKSLGPKALQHRGLTGEFFTLHS